MHYTSSRTSGLAIMSCFRLCVSRHNFFNCTWICWTARLGSYIGVSCYLIVTSKASAWVVSMCCDNVLLRCGINDATNHSQCCPSVKFILASRIMHFNLWSSSQGVSPSSTMISLNLMIDCTYEFGLLNSLFSAIWISVTPAFRLSLECLIYQVSARSCRALTSVTFFILSSITPCTSHMALITNQN